MSTTDPLRMHLMRLLDWREAHAGFDAAVTGVPLDLQGTPPQGLPYSPWQLLEHMRIAQHDILDFCRNPTYVEKKWPDDYWPTNPAPPGASAWDDSVAALHRDREAMQLLVADAATDLYATIPHGSGQTYLREVLRVLAPDGLFFARLASNVGIEGAVGPAGRRARLPDGSERFLVDEEMLLDWTNRLGGRLLDPIKTTNVQQQRCMTTWCLGKR